MIMFAAPCGLRSATAHPQCCCFSAGRWRSSRRCGTVDPAAQPPPSPSGVGGGSSLKAAEDAVVADLAGEFFPVHVADAEVVLHTP
jgi:hypothetical protein